MKPNNPVGADCQKTLVVLHRLLASAQQERYADNCGDLDSRWGRAEIRVK
jgi:hypothetical protein